MGDRSNRPQSFIPFAPRPGDLRDLIVPKKEGEHCLKCNSDIVLNPRYKKDGSVNIAEPQPGQTVFLNRGKNADGTDRVEEMIWSCRINRHPYPYPHALQPHEVKASESSEGEKNTQRPAGAKMSTAGTERWVNEIQGFLNRGEHQKANEAIMQLVLMNEGKKPESFAWLEEHGEASKARLNKGSHKTAGGASAIDKKDYVNGKADTGKKASEQAEAAKEALSSLSKLQKSITDKIEYGGVKFGSSTEESLARSMADFQPYQGYAAHKGRKSSFRPNSQLLDAMLSHGDKKENVEQKATAGSKADEQKHHTKDQITKSEGDKGKRPILPAGLFTGRHSVSKMAQQSAPGPASGKVSPAARIRKSPKTSPSAFLGSLLSGFTDAKARAKGITTAAAAVAAEQADGPVTATAPQPPPQAPVGVDLSTTYVTAGRSDGEEEEEVSGVNDTSTVTDKTPSFMTDKSGEGAGGNTGTFGPLPEEDGSGGKGEGK
ncbi:hypothetical protein ABW21_db0204568 [Orbilia brochopaga]|nr:hypothetical protein ABW21_db0204568 [Drechslerella brochopaga]